MAKATAVISFKAQDSASSADFRLEQQDWEEKIPASFRDWLDESGQTATVWNLMTLWEQYRGLCDEDGTLKPTLLVYLGDLASPYALRASYGSIGGAMLVSDARIDYLQFELDDEQEVDFGTITSAKWEGDVFDENGNSITAPAITLSGRLAKVGQKVDGTMAIEYQVSYYKHEMQIEPRTATEAQVSSEDFGIEDLYASTVRCFCNGEVQRLDIEMPDNFGSCAGSGGSNTHVEDPEDPEEEALTYSVTFEVFDYCTGDVIPGAEVWVDGEYITDSAMLESGEHQLRVSADGYTQSDEDDLTDNDSFTLAGEGSSDAES